MGGGGYSQGDQPPHELVFSKRVIEARARALGDERVVSEVVKALYAYRLLRGEVLAAIANQRLGQGRVDEGLLGQMAMAGFIYGLELPKSGKVAYVLGDAGRSWVRWKLGRKAEPESLVEMYDRRYSRLTHDTYAGDVMAALLLDVRDIGGDVDWRGSWNSPDRGNRYGARWDAYGRVNFYGLAYSFVLEMDCGSEEEPKFGEKVDKYRRYMAQGTWQVALGCGAMLPILTVTTGGEERMANMRTAVRDWLAYCEVADQQWWFTNTARLARATASGDANPLVAPVWDSADGATLCAPLLASDQLQAAVQAAAQQAIYSYDRATSAEQQAMIATMQQMQAALARLRQRL